MEPFRWRRALFLGLVSSAASLAGLVVDTFVPVVLQAGHPLWHNTTSLHTPLVGSLNLSEFVVGCSWHTCIRVDRDKAPLFSRHWRRNRAEILSVSASVYALQTAIN